MEFLGLVEGIYNESGVGATFDEGTKAKLSYRSCGHYILYSRRLKFY